MYLSTTLTAYLARHFLGAFIATFLALATIVALFDFLELMRRGAGRGVETMLLIRMTALRLPDLMQQLLPFAMLFAAIIAFWRLSRANELVVARAAGVSVWQFLLPAAGLALGLGLVQIGVLNPLAASLKSQFERLESVHIDAESDALAVGSTGLWLRQGNQDRQQVIHAARVAGNGQVLEDVIVMLFQPADRYVGRIDAGGARLELGRWVLSDAFLSEPGGATRFVGEHELPTALTLQRIQESFAAPETIPFWQLPAFIAAMERAGFNANTHRLHFHALLSAPLLLVAMVLIAASFALRIQRRAGAGYLIAGGVAVGFLLFFLTNVVQALGLSQTIPVLLSAWMPALVSLALGLTALLHLEDG